MKFLLASLKTFKYSRIIISGLASFAVIGQLSLQ
jgi:hypothetical protein